MFGRVTVFFSLFLLFGSNAFADTIVLKDGTRVEVGIAWQEGEEIKGTGKTSLLSFPLEEVSHIEESERSPRGDLVTEGFQFDVWISGLSIESIMLIAEANNIPLHRTGLITAGKHFNPNVSRKYMKTATSYFYQGHLMGRPAKVYLFVTPLSKLLFSVSVNFNVTSKVADAKKELQDVLEQNYGKPAFSGKRDFFHDQVVWRIGNSSRVSMVSVANSLKVEYTDLQLEKRKIEEEEKIKEEEVRSNQAKDAQKF